LHAGQINPAENENTYNFLSLSEDELTHLSVIQAQKSLSEVVKYGFMIKTINTFPVFENNLRPKTSLPNNFFSQQRKSVKCQNTEGVHI